MNDDEMVTTDLTTWVVPTAPQQRMAYEPLSLFQLERLHSDLHPSRVATRTGGGGGKLSYLEAYDVRATLIRIFGYGNFSVEVTDVRVVHESTYPLNGRDLWRIGVLATTRLTIHQTGAVYSETAAASQSGPDYGEVLDFAVKTAESDALKRCATNLGTQFGLSLYNNGSTQDVVRRVFSPEQREVVEDLNAARSTGPEGSAARARMQARLKTADPAVRAAANADAAAPVPVLAAHDVLPEGTEGPQGPQIITDPSQVPAALAKATSARTRAVKAVS